VLEKGALVNSIFHVPRGQVFFTTPELLEIGGLPFVTPYEKPTRPEALRYYRRVADTYALQLSLGEEVLEIARERAAFRVATRASRAAAQAALEPGASRGTGPATRTRLARHLVLATGYYDNPNRLGVPGEDLPHVVHYFSEGHPYWRRRVVVIGAGNSSVDAALECWRAGAIVTLVHFGEGFDRTVKAWVLPDITNRVKEGSIAARWRSRVRAITPTQVEIVSETSGAVECLPADAVLAMTGYHADTSLLRRLGVPVDPVTGIPAHQEATMATPLPGVYLAGVIASGNDANRLFIENARGHGELIVRDLLDQRRA
jgi:thioredoxin reductase (NADPH)